MLGRNPELTCSAKLESDAGGAASLSAFAACPIEPHPLGHVACGDIEVPERVESWW